MARVQLGESKLKARRVRRRIVFVILAGAALLLLLGILVALSWAPFMRITAVSVVGARTVDAVALQEAVQQEISGGYGYLFARSNIFLYPKDGIVKNLAQQFSTIKTVTVQAEDFHTMAVVVVERQPTALWCGDSIASSTHCYFLDENGLAYAQAALYSGDAYQKYYGPLQTTSAEESAHGQFLTSEEFRSLPALVESLQQTTKAHATAVVVGKGDVRVVFSNGFSLLFGLSDNGGGIVERFTLALGAAPFAKHTLSEFEYLDLRFGDKVYYKLKGQ